MKSLISIMCLCALLSIVSLGVHADLARGIVTSALQGESINVTLTIPNAMTGERFVIGEMLPQGAVMEYWHVTGAQQGKGFSFTKEGRSVIWEFAATVAKPEILYTVRLPGTNRATFHAVYATSEKTHGESRAVLDLSPPIITAPPVIPVIPTPEAPAPVRKSAPTIPLFIVGSIVFVCIGLVSVVESSSRRARRGVAPFGHYTLQFVTQLFSPTASAHQNGPAQQHAEQSAQLHRTAQSMQTTQEYLSELDAASQQPARTAQPVESVAQSAQEARSHDPGAARSVAQSEVWSAPIFDQAAN